MIYENGTLKRILIDGGYVEDGVGTVFSETPIAEQGLQPYKYNGKELDQMNGLNLYDYGARYYESALGRFTTMDPMCEKYYSISPYAYCANNPVRYIDPEGEDIWDMVKFAIQNPVAAYTIGSVNNDVPSNISSSVARFAARTGLTENNPSHEGSQVNATRHALWQASITSIFGQEIAQQAGNAHEDNPNVDLNIRTFTGKNALSQADQSVDLLNNQIGREIGKNNMGTTIKELTNMVLDLFNKDGLFTTTQNADGSVTISRTKISDEQLQQAKDKISNLEGNGMTSTESRAKEEKNRGKFEENQRKFGTFK